ncbi:hypothetical protein [uncultured Hoeflea sp.]|uniref:hypothetical protein n=1 Tax=uncultured Hoeflea sp. TaxID=538666 RepID=UPI0026134956|nr:hypothetical protein [uncultured Hoeflea sp.]
MTRSDRQMSHPGTRPPVNAPLLAPDRPRRVVRGIAPFLLVMAAVLLAACSNSNSWRQKLMVTVETPEGARTAASVVSVTMRDTKGYEWMTLPQARGASYELTGEAVVLELAPGRYLFALLKGLPYATNVFFPDEPPVETAPRLADMRTSLALPAARYPLMVTFADITDPASVQRVDPDDLAASFGEGYALSSITLAITDEKVTKGKVEAVLGWWCDYRSKYFVDRYAEKAENEFARNIGGSHFRTGECQ